MIMSTLRLFILLLASIWLGVQLYHDPGYLLIAINHWTIETTLGLAVPCLVFLFFIFHALLLLSHWITHTPKSWRAWQAKRRSHNAQEKTRKGLIEFSEGHWLRAKNHLINALPDTEAPLLNYLTAARAAQEMGDSKLRDDYLREAQQSMPEAKIAVELTQAQLQLANRQWEQALATLRHLQDLSPQHPYVLKLLMHLYEEVNDWPQLIALLPAIKRHKILTKPAFHQVEKNAYRQSIIDLIKQNQHQPLKHLIENLPKSLIRDPDLMAEYIGCLLDHHENKDAETLLRQCLQKQFNEHLIMLYGKIKDDKANLGFAENFIKTNPHSAGLYLSLGRICKSKQLWGKAKTYLKESIKLQPTSEAYAELGELLEQLGDPTGACNAYREGISVDKSSK